MPLPTLHLLDLGPETLLLAKSGQGALSKGGPFQGHLWDTSASGRTKLSSLRTGSYTLLLDLGKSLLPLLGPQEWRE